MDKRAFCSAALVIYSYGFRTWDNAINIDFVLAVVALDGVDAEDMDR